jgi:hypothetical protein
MHIDEYLVFNVVNPQEKVKITFTLEQAMKAQRGKRGIILLLF